MATDRMTTILQSFQGIDIAEYEMLLVTGCGGSGKSVLLEDVLWQEGVAQRWLAEILAVGVNRADSLPRIPHPLLPLGCIAPVSYRHILSSITHQTVAEALHLLEPLKEVVGKSPGDLCPFCGGLLVRVSLLKWLEGWLEDHRDSVVFVGYRERLPPSGSEREEFLARLDRQGISRFLIDNAYEVKRESLGINVEREDTAQDVTVIIDRVRARVGQGGRILDSVRALESSAPGPVSLVVLEPSIEVAVPRSNEPYLCHDCKSIIDECRVPSRSLTTEGVANYSLDHLAKQLASAPHTPELAFIVDRIARAKRLGLEKVVIGASIASLPQAVIEGLALVAMVQPGVHGITYLLDEPFLYSDIAAISRAVSYLSDLVKEKNTVVLATAAAETAAVVGAKAARVVPLPVRNEMLVKVVERDDNQMSRSLAAKGELGNVVVPATSPDVGSNLRAKNGMDSSEQRIVISARELWQARGASSQLTFIETLRVSRHIAKLLCRLPAAKVRVCHDVTLAKTIRKYARSQAAASRLASFADASQEYRILDDLAWRGVSIRQLLLGQISELLEFFKFASWSRSLSGDVECLGLQSLPSWLPLTSMSYSELTKVSILRAVRFQLRRGEEENSSLVLDGVFRGLDLKDRHRVRTFLANNLNLRNFTILGDLPQN